jgi:hypothetical protein
VHWLASLSVLGAYGLANVRLLCVDGVHDHDQGGQEMLQDKIKVRGGGRVERWQGERHGARYGQVFDHFSTFIIAAKHGLIQRRY